METKIQNGYLCQPFWDLNCLSMFEPKVEESKTGGKVKRYFAPETMSFFQRYIKDFNITGAWVRRYSSEEHNSASYNSSIKLAGYRAGLWRFKKAQKGQDLAEGEKLAPNGQVYRLKAVSNNQKGTQHAHKEWLTEGKMTTSYTVMKHTFVSLAGLHGLSLDDCAEQCGTDPTTIRDFYQGTLGDKLRSVILGEKTFEPWKDWIERFVDPLYTKRYNELMHQGKKTVDIQIATKEAAVIVEVE
jgi:dihydrofolate reductase